MKEKHGKLEANVDYNGNKVYEYWLNGVKCSKEEFEYGSVNRLIGDDCGTGPVEELTVSGFEFASMGGIEFPGPRSIIGRANYSESESEVDHLKRLLGDVGEDGYLPYPPDYAPDGYAVEINKLVDLLVNNGLMGDLLSDKFIPNPVTQIVENLIEHNNRTNQMYRELRRMNKDFIHEARNALKWVKAHDRGNNGNKWDCTLKLIAECSNKHDL